MSQFESKMLYDQNCVTEDAVNVFSSIYAVLWTYPGAMSQTSSRIRLTCVYSYADGLMSVHAGTIEKWRNEGWSMIDEYHDDRHLFDTPHEFRDRLMKQAQSFLMGIPLLSLDTGYEPTDGVPPITEDTSPSKPSFKVLDYKSSKDKIKTKKKSKDSDKQQKKDQDFDWI